MGGRPCAWVTLAAGPHQPARLPLTSSHPAAPYRPLIPSTVHPPVHPSSFCVFNNVAVAAAHALEARGLKRIAVVDFDVHHGNGTQSIFYDDPRVLVISIHQVCL
jgi:hypothetical protein